MLFDKTWSIIIPTRRRHETLCKCLDALVRTGLHYDDCEILIYDNGYPETSEDSVVKFEHYLPIRYIVNPAGHGFGYSVSRGLLESKARYILELNDDALVPKGLFQQLQNAFESDSSIGIVGVCAKEIGYQLSGTRIGCIDTRTCEIISNFCVQTETLIDVEHIYGFCFAYRRDIVELGLTHDAILLSRDYSNGNRIETDQCLTARALGFRVVYDGRIVVEHLAKPRNDLDEKSSRWRINYVRNTLYLFLKHYGWFGRQAIALRFFLFQRTGIMGLVTHPSWENLVCFYEAIYSRISAIYHWLFFLLSRRKQFGRSKENRV